MPMDKSLYPKDWDTIALAIKTEVAWACESCGKLCTRPGETPTEFCDRIAVNRLSECPVVRDYLTHPRRYQLGVAHLDHTPGNCDRANLRAWCTSCHCRYDLRAMALKRRLKAERAGQLTLPIN